MEGMPEWAVLVGQFGFPLVVAAFLIWNQAARERKCDERQGHLQDQLNSLQDGALRRCTEAIVQNSEVLCDVKEMMKNGR